MPVRARCPCSDLRRLTLQTGRVNLGWRCTWSCTQSCSPGLEGIDCSNLTTLREPGQEELAAFLERQGMTVVASVPCSRSSNDAVQGANLMGVMGRSLISVAWQGAGR